MYKFYFYIFFSTKVNLSKKGKRGTSNLKTANSKNVLRNFIKLFV